MWPLHFIHSAMLAFVFWFLFLYLWNHRLGVSWLCRHPLYDKGYTVPGPQTIGEGPRLIWIWQRLHRDDGLLLDLQWPSTGHQSLDCSARNRGPSPRWEKINLLRSLAFQLGALPLPPPNLMIRQILNIFVPHWAVLNRNNIENVLFLPLHLEALSLVVSRE